LEIFKKLNAIAKEGKRITFIGGSFLATELAAAVSSVPNHGQIAQVFPEEGVFSLTLPTQLSEKVTSKMTNLGVNIYPGSFVSSITKESDGTIHITTSTGQVIETDQVVMCVGFQPLTGLAQKANLEVDPKNGGIVVNSELEARRDVFVAGDLASYYDESLKVRRRIEHYNHADESGRIAGRNMAGESVRPYKQISDFWCDLPGVNLNAVGLTDPRTSDTRIVTLTEPSGEDGFGSGVICYTNKQTKQLVGVICWNSEDAHSVLNSARILILNSMRLPDDNERVAKLFTVKENH